MRSKDFFLNTEKLAVKDLLPGLGHVMAYFNKHHGAVPKEENLTEYFYLETNNEDKFDVTVKVGTEVFNQKGTMGQLNLHKDPWLDFVAMLPSGLNKLEINVKATLSKRSHLAPIYDDPDQKIASLKKDFMGHPILAPAYPYEDAVQYEIMLDEWKFKSGGKTMADATLPKLREFKSGLEDGTLSFGLTSLPKNVKSKVKSTTKAPNVLPAKVPFVKSQVIPSKNGITNVEFDVTQEVRDLLLNKTLKVNIFCLKNKKGIFVNTSKPLKKDQLTSSASITRLIFGHQSNEWFHSDDEAVITLLVKVGTNQESFSGTEYHLGRGPEKDKWNDFMKLIPDGTFSLELQMSTHNTTANNEGLKRKDAMYHRNDPDESLLYTVSVFGGSRTTLQEVLSVKSSNTDIQTIKAIATHFQRKNTNPSIIPDSWLKNYPKTIADALDLGIKRQELMEEFLNSLKANDWIKVGMDPLDQKDRLNPFNLGWI